MNFAILAAVRSLHALEVASPTLIQSNSGTANGTSITVNYASTPTDGNLLVAVVASNDGSATNPTGWSTAIDKVDVTDDDFVRISYKVASGDGVAVAFTAFAGNNHALSIFEFYLPTATPLDVTSSAGESAGATSQTSGTTAATAQANEISIVGFHIRADVSSPSLSNSFILQHDLANGATTLLSGYKFETGTGTKESTASWTTAGNSVGAIATFKMA